MVIATKGVLAAVMALCFGIQIFLICSANANPAEDFFFTDQSRILQKRAAIERRNATGEKSKINALKATINDMNDEDGGSGIGPNEGSGVGPNEGSGVDTNEGSGSGFTEGNGDDTASTFFETNTGTEWQTSNLQQETSTALEVTGLTEQTETIGEETSTMLPKSTIPLENESGEKEETTAGVSTMLSESPVTLAGSSIMSTNENTETRTTQQLDVEENITISTEDSTQSTIVPQTTFKETTEELPSTEMTERSTFTVGTEEPEPLSKLVSIQVCGKRFYCQAGRRGPCPANEIVVEEINSTTVEAPSYCSALSSFPWKGCLSNIDEEIADSTSSGRCTLKSTAKPCSGLPSNYRYHPIKKICRPTSKSTGNWLAYECSEDQVHIGLNQNLGSCICLNQEHLIYVGDNQCYHPYTLGPCNKGMWLVPSSRREMDCRRSPCPENQIDGKHFYWNGNFHGPAGCYRPNTRGPCPDGRIFIIDDYVLGHARCELD